MKKKSKEFKRFAIPYPFCVTENEGVCIETKDGVVTIAVWPIWISRMGENLQLNEFYYEISWLIKGKEYKEVVSRGLIFKASSLVDLAKYGAPVSSVNTTKLVSYFQAFEDANWKALKKDAFKVASRFGWHERTFYFGDKAISSKGESNFLFIPREGSYGDQVFIKYLVAKGDFETWKTVINKLAPHPICVFCLSASFAVPFLRILTLANLIIHLFGESTEGKTLTIKVAASVWGRPDIGTGLIKNWNTTLVGLEQLASLFCDLPIFLDELTAKANQDIKNFIYMFAQGSGRVRGAKAGGLRDTPYWHSIIFSTGECSITGVLGKKFQGQLVRTLEIYGSPLGSERELAEELETVLIENYGHAGRIFLRTLLQSVKEEDIQGALSETSKLMHKYLGSCNAYLMRVIPLLSAIALFGGIASIILDILSPQIVLESVLKVTEDYLANLEEERDYASRALDYLKSQAISNEEAFTTNIWKDRWGRSKQGTGVAFFPHKFTEVLKQGDFDPNRVLRDFKSKGWIECDPGRSQKTAKIGGKSQKVVLIKWDVWEQEEKVTSEVTPGNRGNLKDMIISKFIDVVTSVTSNLSNSYIQKRGSVSQLSYKNRGNPGNRGKLGQKSSNNGDFGVTSRVTSKNGDGGNLIARLYPVINKTVITTDGIMGKLVQVFSTRCALVVGDRLVFVHPDKIKPIH